MVIDGLECGKCEQKSGLTNRHSRYPLSESRTQQIEKETLNRVVESPAERIRHVQPMVPRVDGLVQKFVHVHGAMREVLPGVDEEPVKFFGESCERWGGRYLQRGEELGEWNCPPIDIINNVLSFVKP